MVTGDGGTGDGGRERERERRRDRSGSTAPLPSCHRGKLIMYLFDELEDLVRIRHTNEGA
jgi:hypothetical protein